MELSYFQIVFSWSNITVQVPGSGGGRTCLGFKKSEVRPAKTILQNGNYDRLINQK